MNVFALRYLVLLCCIIIIRLDAFPKPLSYRRTALSYGKPANAYKGSSVIQDDDMEHFKFKIEERYTSKYWLKTLLTIPKSDILKMVWQQIMCGTLTSTLLYLLYRNGFLCVGVHNVFPWTILSTALGLLLVFRTTSAYERFWESCKLMEEMVDTLRYLTIQMYIITKDDSERNLTRYQSLAAAFMPILLDHLANENELNYLQKEEISIQFEEAIFKTVNENRALLRYGKDLKMAKNLIDDKEKYETDGSHLSAYDREALMNSYNKPLCCTQLLFDECLTTVYAKNHRLHDCVVLALGALNRIVGSCERIVRYPVPRSYSRHTSRFLTIFTFSMPMAMLATLGMGTILVTVFVCWALYSIEEIGHRIENPFDANKRDILLSANKCVALVEQDIKEIFRRDSI